MREYQPTPEFEDQVRKAANVPSAHPEFVNHLRSELAGRPVKVRPQFQLKLAWVLAFVLVALALIASAPMVAKALMRLFGYVPDVGLVENTGNLRMLAGPVSATRDGVTLTITSVFAYADHVELIYDVKGIDPANSGDQPQNAGEDGKAFCGPQSSSNGSYLSDGDAALRLPDGTLVQRVFGNEYPQNVFAMKPVYKVAIPSDVTQLTLVLKCIPWARLGAVPENWEVPFKLVAVPAGTVVGAPVIDAIATSQPVATAVVSSTEAAAPITPSVTVRLERMVPTDRATVFYFSMDMENRDPSLVSIMPVHAYVLDSLGRKIGLIGNFAWEPFEHRVGSPFEFTSESKPAEGPLTLVIENAVAYYAPLYVDPPQAMPDQMSFHFDAGENPQYGQSWALNNEFDIAGYKVKVTSARATVFGDSTVPGVEYPGISQGYDYGYDFVVQVDPPVKMQVWIDIISEMSQTPMCWLTNNAPLVPASSSVHYVKLCRGGYPKGNVRVTFGELSILVENAWRVTWAP